MLVNILKQPVLRGYAILQSCGVLRGVVILPYMVRLCPMLRDGSHKSSDL